MTTKATVNLIMAHAQQHNADHITRHKKSPLRVVNVGYDNDTKSWRLQMSIEIAPGTGAFFPEANVVSNNAQEVIDLAFDCCEQHNARINIIVGTKGKWY